ncbi:MAG: prolipoprotein diacylglyceryl transferase [Anaerolineae bacterium]|nr:prolipoprotein diacylglyceryl transferase [Anaerolineae bacterium]
MHPILLRLGGFELRSYSVLLILGLLACLWWSLYEGKRLGIPKEQILDYLLVMSVGGILGLGMRALPLRFFLSGFRTGPQLSIWTHYGGALIANSLLFAMLSTQLYGRIVHIQLARMRDIVAPGLLLTTGIARWGCFLNGCCFGYETNSFLRLYLPDVFGNWAYRYPTQLMQSALNLTLFGVVVLLRKRKPFDGYIALMSAILYFAGRFVMSFFRADNYFLFGIAEMQLYSILYIAAAGALLWHLFRRAKATSVEKESDG